MTEQSFSNNTSRKAVPYKQQVQTVASVFLTALLLNIAWEFAHHVLYVHYRGGDITSLILLKASFFDAGFITLVFSPFLLWTNFKKTWWVPVVISFFFAVGLERFALETGRWAYQQGMPLVPVFGSGISPTIQLALTGWIASVASKCINKNKLSQTTPQ